MIEKIDELIAHRRKAVGLLQGDIGYMMEKCQLLERELQGLEITRALLTEPDGVALTSMAHPVGPKAPNLRLRKSALVTAEIELPEPPQLPMTVEQARKVLVGASADKPKRPRRSRVEKVVVAKLQEAGKPLTPHQLRQDTDISTERLIRWLDSAVQRGVLVCEGGRYVLAAEGAK